MALNGAHDYLLDNGIIPDFAVCLDARQENADFYIRPQESTIYLIASQCDPSVFEALSGHNVLMWHSGTGQEMRDLIGREFIEINGGCTVGLRALPLSYAIGFTDLNLYGYDSSFEEDHHAYSQPLNDGCDVIEVEADGRSFMTSPTMAKQAYQFQSVVMMLHPHAEITVHGAGLLPAIHQAMQRPVDPNDLEAVERRKYCNMWAFSEYRKYSPGEDHVDQALAYMKPGTLIDFGCGTGRPAQRFKNLGFDVTGIDHAYNCLDEDIDIKLVIANLWDLPDIEAEYGYCTDVMEHIPQDKVDDVIAGISNRVKTCFFAIHTDHDAMGSLIGETLHLTVQDADWWHDKLSVHFNNVEQIGTDAIFIGRNQ